MLDLSTLLNAMKSILLLFFIWSSVAFADESQLTQWPPEGAVFSVAYCYDYIQDERGAFPVFPDGSLHKGVIKSGTTRLTEKQHERLLSIVTTEGNFEEEEESDCYYPHHAFVFYDKSRKPVGWLGLCLSCGTYAFSSKEAPKYITFRNLTELCRELKLPTFDDPDGQGRAYTELYRTEQPEKERQNVISWHQYLRLGRRPLDGTPPQPSDKAELEDENDPFAE